MSDTEFGHLGTGRRWIARIAQATTLITTVLLSACMSAPPGQPVSANLGCRVSNMERISGYLTASIPQLPPEQQAAMHNEALAEYAQIKGYPPSVLSKQGPMGMDMDMDFSAMMERGGGAGLTLSMVKQSARQTKVKMRFDGTYYPRRVDALYKKVWAEVDKQMFLDKALD